ncbi:MAG: acylphosphatase [Bdellovibrionaceae bacterium]|nr:acylphosphatase [Bdellovibrionales bacterium]MCB9253811.1 acylphosphatase [Pseudobdellovibrionaceae bacterium]
MLEQVRFRVCGRVQGVGFRYSTLERANSLALVGWVKNTPDGCVEVLAEGPGAALEALIAWCGSGPPLAKVSSVEVISRVELDGKSLPEFRIER